MTNVSTLATDSPANTAPDSGCDSAANDSACLTTDSVTTPARARRLYYVIVADGFVALDDDLGVKRIVR